MNAKVKTDIIGVDLTGKTVRLRQAFFKPGIDAADNLFRCEGGFGCSPCAMGTKVFGRFIKDGEVCHIHRHDVEEVVE